MKEIQNDDLIQQSGRKSNEPSNTNVAATPENQSNENIQEPEKNETEEIFQRKPQFRLKENSKRRFS